MSTSWASLLISFLYRLNGVDWVFLVVVFLFILKGIQKGVLRSIVHLSVTVLAVFIASVGSSLFSPAVASFFEPLVSEAVAEQIADVSNSSVQTFSNRMASGIMASLQTTVIHIALFALIFALVMLVWSLLNSRVSLLVNLPVVKGLDLVFGAICGGLIGTTIYLVVLYVGNHYGFVQSTAIENSFFLGKLVCLLGILV